MSKHGRARLDTYFTVHANWMAKLKQEAFVLSDTLELIPIKGTPFLKRYGSFSQEMRVSFGRLGRVGELNPKQRNIESEAFFAGGKGATTQP